MVFYQILLIVGIVIGVCSQLSLKKGMNKANIKSFFKVPVKELFVRMFINPFVIIGFLLYGLSLLFWMVVVSNLELSYAYPIVASSYFFIALFSSILFNEKVSWKRWLSIAMIMVGVVIIGFS